MINSFEKIYKNNIWGSSGTGSRYSKRNQKLINELNDFIINNDIKRIADYGCGDFEIMKHLNFENINYVGYDKVDFIINRNKNNYENDSIQFINTDDIPKDFDLVIVKDVLQHHQDEDVIHLLNGLIQNNKYVYCINGYKFMRKPNNTVGESRNINNRYRYYPLHSIEQPLLQFKQYEIYKYTYYAKEYIIYKK